MRLGPSGAPAGVNNAFCAPEYIQLAQKKTRKAVHTLSYVDEISTLPSYVAI